VGFGFSGKKVLEPNHAHWIKSLFTFRQCFGRREYRPIVLCVAKHRQVSLAVHFRDDCLSRHYRWTASMARRIFSFLISPSGYVHQGWLVWWSIRQGGAL